MQIAKGLPYEAREEFCQIFSSFFGQWSFKKNAFEIYWPLEPKYLVLDTICMTLDTPIEKYPWFNTLKMGGWVQGGWFRKSPKLCWRNTWMVPK